MNHIWSQFPGWTQQISGPSGPRSSLPDLVYDEVGTLPPQSSDMPSGCPVAAQWLPSGCPVAAQWLPSGSWSWWMVMVDRDAICEFGIFMEFWSRNNLRMLEMNGVDSQDAYVAAASLFLTSPYMVGCHREPVVFGNESPSGGIALQHLLLVVWHICLCSVPLLFQHMFSRQSYMPGRVFTIVLGNCQFRNKHEQTRRNMNN